MQQIEDYDSSIPLFLPYSLAFFGICREKQLLASGDNFGRDLTGVQNLQKKHQRFKDELDSHQGKVQVRGGAG